LSRKTTSTLRTQEPKTKIRVPLEAHVPFALTVIFPETKVESINTPIEGREVITVFNPSTVVIPVGNDQV
jgi:hypothetical protein